MDQIMDLSKPYHSKIFKGCLSQIPLGLFLNTLHILSSFKYNLTYRDHDLGKASNNETVTCGSRDGW